MSPRKYHGDDSWEIIGGMLMAIVQFIFAMIALVFVGVREMISRLRR